jgi:hypothetical protein
MNELLAIVFIAISVISILKTLGYRGVAVSASVILLCLFSSLISRIGELKETVFGLIDGDALYASRDLVKILGVSYLFSLCESTCLSMGEGEIAKVVEVWGRVEIIALLLPYFREILELGGKLL